MIASLIVVSLVALLAFVLAGTLFLRLEEERIDHSRTRAELGQETLQHTAARQRLRETEEASGEFVVAVSPLIEQTDWMTGRWGGQFDTLVRLEYKRNEAVRKARSAMFRLPFVEDRGKQLFREGNLLATTAQIP